jgi:flagellar biosynthesis protein FlhA
VSATRALDVLDTGARRNAEVGLAVVVVGIIGLLILPLPALVLDLLLAISIAVSLVVLLAAFYTVEPLELSSFPSLLLLLTLFRLALNVRSTTLILSEADGGRVIEAFGQFVIGGNYAVGIVLFLILVGINFIVITKGSGRVAEVAARFTLDSMPGKQMAIDADLNGGFIDEAEARRRRETVAREADFYGAMDGASKFVKGDAIAGLLITAVNLVGGIFIGAVQHGMDVPTAVSTFTILTVGDGLVSQIPALMVSTAAGLIVTKASGGGMGTGASLVAQLGAHPRALAVAGGFMVTVGLVPGMPTLPFVALGAGSLFLARRLGRAQKTRDETAAREEERQLAPVEQGASPLDELLLVHPVRVVLGYALIPLADESQKGDLVPRIRMIRDQLARTLGLVLPEVAVMDDVSILSTEYLVEIRGAEVARGEVMPRFLLALDTGGVVQQVEGIEGRDPAHGLPARWIARTRRAEAESYGYVVVDPNTVIATHLVEVFRTHAADLLGREDVQAMVDRLRRTHPALVNEVVPSDKGPGKVSLGILHRVLQRLLREQVPVRDTVTILEALGDAADGGIKDPEALTEHARRALAPAIGRIFADERGVVRGITVGERLARDLLRMWGGDRDTELLRDEEALGEVLRALHALMERNRVEGRYLPLIVHGALRVGVRRLIEPVMPRVPVVAFEDLPPQLNVDFVDTWDLAALHAA